MNDPYKLYDPFDEETRRMPKPSDWDTVTVFLLVFIFVVVVGYLAFWKVGII